MKDHEDRQIDFCPERAPVGTVWVATSPTDRMVMWIRLEGGMLASIDATSFIEIDPADCFDLSDDDIERYDMEEP